MVEEKRRRLMKKGERRRGVKEREEEDKKKPCQLFPASFSLHSLLDPVEEVEEG